MEAREPKHPLVVAESARPPHSHCRASRPRFRVRLKRYRVAAASESSRGTRCSCRHLLREGREGRREEGREEGFGSSCAGKRAGTPEPCHP